MSYHFQIIFIGSKYKKGIIPRLDNPKASIASFTKMNKYQQEILDELFKDYKKEWRMDFCDSCSYLRKWFGETLIFKFNCKKWSR